MKGTLHMVSEPELKHFGLIGLKMLLHLLFWKYMYTDLGVVQGRLEHWPKNQNKDDPIPCQLNVRSKHVSTQVSGYSLVHLRICLQIAKTIALSLFLSCTNKMYGGLEVFLDKIMVDEGIIIVPIII